ncbi:MAG: lipoyl(octanoyl) transferase LipB [Anaerolineae bacterium]|uniref:lipoyl(octanoyl) transferase LipB n=1 Tax=Thermoflexus sp. TaxID=1969742 RepID=UPI0025FD26DD|nr:lipoyl(octanoyl) transferase LipB [Thermoflexus sp.]MCS7351750.1 lipoyl(octanoyl) transferase LipB [Thermoflexus sp.]MDW8181209.1 lipoyl(octanoyl) transferase LipB [Anaerolineae bacterium]
MRGWWSALGVVEYEAAWGLQRALAEARAAQRIPDTLLLLEHPHVFTLGRSARPEHILWDEAERARRGVQVVLTDRGGDVTYHGPGQIVGYLILDLPGLGLDKVAFVRRIEQMLVETLARFGIPAGTLPGAPGVWVQPDTMSRCAWCPPALRRAPAKIAAIGARVDARGITMHGFALNVCPDLTYFTGIVPCGIADKGVVSMAMFLGEPEDEAARSQQIAAVQEALARSFGEVFGLEVEPVDPVRLWALAKEAVVPSAAH